MSRMDYAADPDYTQDAIWDIKNSDIVKAQISDNMYDIIVGMITNKISKIFIYQNSSPVGIITDKDIIRFFYNDRSGRRFDEITAGEVMSRICYVMGSLTCKQAAQMMLINKISSLGIGSARGLEGIITKTDLLQYFVNRSSDAQILDYMTVSYFSASAETRLYEIIRKMITCDISRVLLTDGDKTVGVITNGDIFRITMSINKLNIVQTALTADSEENRLWSESGFVGSKQAGEAMTEGIITISSTQSMKDAANIMLGKKIDSLGVNNSNGDLVGLINKTNILYAMANAG